MNKYFIFDSSSNCSLNKVNLGQVECEIESCSNTLLTCITKNSYDIHELDNTGSDPSMIIWLTDKMKLVYYL